VPITLVLDCHGVSLPSQPISMNVLMCGREREDNASKEGHLGHLH